MEEDFFTEEEKQMLRETACGELQVFLKELSTIVAKLKKAPGDMVAKTRAEAIFHTIKGSASMCGLDDVSRIGADIEAVLRKNDSAAPLPDTAVKKLHEAVADIRNRIKSAG